MNVRTWIPLIVAVALGITAAVVARKSILSRTQIVRQETVKVVVAKTAIAPGESLTAEQLTTAPFPGSVPPPQSFSNPSELVGRVITAPMLVGQPFQESLLAARGASPGLAALIPTGLRAVTVDVTESGGVAGLLAPGSHVDVVSTTMNSENQNKTVTRTIVQNVTVIAVGQRLTTHKPDDKEPQVSRTVTVLASPHDAETLDLASTVSRLRLVLRSNDDDDATADDGVMLAELRGNPETPSPAGESIAQLTPPPQVVLVNPPPPQTQPSVFGKPTDEAPAHVMTVIAGNDERRILFSQPRPSRTAVTDTQGDVIPH
jgi:pilus assembly protein CpaB